MLKVESCSSYIKGVSMPSAVISDCGCYRYWLTRPGDLLTQGRPAVFCMLNPSTADGLHDDRTIGRCKSFAAANGYSGIVVINLFAYRTPYPKDLKAVSDPVGPDNDDYLTKAARSYGQVICAWGKIPELKRVRQVIDIFRRHDAEMLCLGHNLDGSPKHPLYVPGDRRMEPLLPSSPPYMVLPTKQGSFKY